MLGLSVLNTVHLEPCVLTPLDHLSRPDRSSEIPEPDPTLHFGSNISTLYYYALMPIAILLDKG